MAIVKMKRLRLLGLNDERDDLLNALLPLSCVEVSESAGRLNDPEYAALLERGETNEADYLAIRSLLNSALDILSKYAPGKKKLFRKRRSVSREEFFSGKLWEDARKAAAKLSDLENSISSLRAEQSRLSMQKASLAPWESEDTPLDMRGTAETSLLFATVPGTVPFEDIKSALSKATELAEAILVRSDSDVHHFIVIYHSSVQDAVYDALKVFGFTNVTFEGLKGTAAANIAAIDAKLKELDAIAAKDIEKAASYEKYKPDFELAYDRCVQELARETAKEKLLSGKLIFALEGWVTADGMPEFEKVAGSFTCAWETEDPDKDENVPVLLKNPHWMEPINMVTDMYSLPAYRGIDPNPLIFWFFIIFFGFMLADVAYGLIVFTICEVIVHKFKPKNTMGYMFRLGRYLGVSMLLWGVAIGGFFGDATAVVSQTFLGISTDQFPAWLQTFVNAPLINPLKEPMKVLAISLAMGGVHLIFGQCIHIYMCFRDKHGLDGILDVVPWWVVFAGAAYAYFTGSAVLLIIGGVGLICTQGHTRRGFFGKLLGGILSLYDVTSWLSDILSYCRLMALMLATSVIATVVNTLGAMPGSIIVFVIVFLIGHSFNIGVNCIGTYVHSARLQYLEFFSKFYEEGGVAFSPLAYNTKYVDIIQEDR